MKGAEVARTRRTGGGRRTSAPVVKIKEKEVIRQVEALVAPVLAADGMELVLVEYRRESGGRVMRLFIDKPGGITLDDCTGVSRHTGDLLDVSLGDIGPYRLEVSSPGLDRPLVKPADFERFAGERIRLRLKAPLDGRKNYKGRLSASDAEGITIETDTGPVRVRYGLIAWARLNPAVPS